MKCSVSSLIQRGDTDGVMESRRRCVLVIPFELWQYCTTVFTAVVPRRCVVFRSKLSAGEVRSLGFPTAHRLRGNCYRMMEV